MDVRTTMFQITDVLNSTHLQIDLDEDVGYVVYVVTLHNEVGSTSHTIRLDVGER